MNKKLSRLIEPNLQPYFLSLALFIVLSVPVQPLLAAAEAAVLVALCIVHHRQTRRRRRSVKQYVEAITSGVDSISQNSMLNTPLPVAVFRAEGGEIIWVNDAFLDLSGVEEDVFDLRIEDLASGFDCRRAPDGTFAGAPVVVGGKSCQVYCAASRMGKAEAAGSAITAYFVDVSESEALKKAYEDSRLVVAILMVDNYEDIMRAGSDVGRSSIQAQVDECLGAWVDGTGAMLRKYNRDRYFLICDAQCFDALVEGKFSVLEAIHQIVSTDGVAASLSIGAGKDFDNYEEACQWAEKSIEMALSRGGDQAVVRDRLDFQFYGGRAKSAEKRSKVKSRVMAKALGDLITDAREVYVMGHQYADMDAVGAAAGICCAARKRGKKAQIVIDLEGNNARPLVRKLADLPEYDGVFISGPDAFLHAQPGALLVVVDTNRPDLVENRQLLDACNRVAVIDHHRRAADYIENPALSFHEPYASSASELVAELLQYMVDSNDLLPTEAGALLAGMVLDTKNFTRRTGSRTFEAAAYLRRSGADTTEVRRYFQSDLGSMIARYDIIRNATMVHGDIAVAVAENEVPRVTAAQAADDLLGAEGVQASIVLYRQGDGVSMSGRSQGEINVQLILEPLGGGGNATSAGGHIPISTVEGVRGRLMEAIDHYFES